MTRYLLAFILGAALATAAPAAADCGCWDKIDRIARALERIASAAERCK